MIYGILDLILEARINSLIVINTLLLTIYFVSLQQLVKLIDPPVVFVMVWSKLSQQIPKGNPNLAVDLMPGLSGTKKVAMRVPTCLPRFNGIHSTRQIAGGFFLNR